MFIFVCVCRTTPPCCSWVSVLRAALGCSRIWGQRLNTTNEPLEQATSGLRAYWRLLMTQTVRVSTHGKTGEIHICISHSVMALHVIRFLMSQDSSGNICNFSSVSLASSAEDAVLRSIRSAPCFPGANRRLSSLAGRAPPSTSHLATLPLLPHSWSTGSLCVPPALSSTPLHLLPHSAEGGTCQWTVGIG